MITVNAKGREKLNAFLRWHHKRQHAERQGIAWWIYLVESSAGPDGEEMIAEIPACDTRSGRREILEFDRSMFEKIEE